MLTLRPEPVVVVDVVELVELVELPPPPPPPQPIITAAAAATNKNAHFLKFFSPQTTPEKTHSVARNSISTLLLRVDAPSTLKRSQNF
jgi:hypothetical protein